MTDINKSRLDVVATSAREKGHIRKQMQVCLSHCAFEKGQLRSSNKSLQYASQPSFLYNKYNGLVLKNWGLTGNFRPRLHDTVFISYRIGFISDWPSVYTIPFSFHIGLASCLHENAPIRYASYRFRVLK